MAGFDFRLENEDGTPADPPVLHTAVPNWQACDTDPAWRGQDARRRRSQSEHDGRNSVLVVAES